MYIQQLGKQLQDHTIHWDKIGERLERDEIGKQDIETDILWMEPDGTFTIEGVTGYQMAKGAERQIFAQFAPCGANYLKKCPSDLLAHNINHWICTKLGKSYLVRTKDTGQKKLIRAVLSERYAKLDNLPIFEDVYHTFHHDYTPVSFNLSETHFHLRLAHHEAKNVNISNFKKGDIVHTGCHVSNSETGLGSVRLAALTYRLICSNGLLSSHELASNVKTHMGKEVDLHHFFTQGLEYICRYGLELIEFLKQSHNDTFDREKAEALVEYIGKNYRWNKVFIECVKENLLAEESTKFGLIQAITHTVKNVKPDDRLRFERQAGELLARSAQNMANHAYRGVSLN